MSKEKKEVKKSTARKLPKTMYILNCMRAPWIVPRQLIPGESMSDTSDMNVRKHIISHRANAILSNTCALVSTEAFEYYYTHCKAFQAKIDGEYLRVVKSPANLKSITQEVLKCIREAKPPAILQGDGRKLTAMAVGVGDSSAQIDMSTMQTLNKIRPGS